MYSKPNSANIVRETLMDEDGNEIDWSAQMLIGIYKRNVTPVLTEGKSYYIQAETKSGKTEKQQMVLFYQTQHYRQRRQISGRNHMKIHLHPVLQMQECLRVT